eukprot:GHVN01089273.1.p1 GENE.GHVN01089273.1~~GHVN01089273.1.p1  ORF type:complete len:271 (-),score=29.03 GHVN01089273.1:9-821(-)
MMSSINHILFEINLYNSPVRDLGIGPIEMSVPILLRNGQQTRNFSWRREDGRLPVSEVLVQAENWTGEHLHPHNLTFTLVDILGVQREVHPHDGHIDIRALAPNTNIVVSIEPNDSQIESSGQPSRSMLRCIQAPSDGSCLFWCINFLIHDGLGKVRDIRRDVAAHIESDPDQYSDVVLDCPREDYMRWITRQDSWGGYIELNILSHLYKTQIIAFDTGAERRDVYGEEYTTCIILMYNGSHYDAVVEQNSGNSMTRQFSTTNTEILQQA